MVPCASKKGKLELYIFRYHCTTSRNPQNLLSGVEAHNGYVHFCLWKPRFLLIHERGQTEHHFHALVDSEYIPNIVHRFG